MERYEDEKGFFNIIKGEVFRPVTFHEGRMVVDNSKLAYERESSRNFAPSPSDGRQEPKFITGLSFPNPFDGKRGRPKGSRDRATLIKMGLVEGVDF